MRRLWLAAGLLAAVLFLGLREEPQVTAPARAPAPPRLRLGPPAPIVVEQQDHGAGARRPVSEADLEEAPVELAAEPTATPPEAVDPRDLGFSSEAALHAAVRHGFGIPADRPLVVRRAERDGVPVVRIGVAPR
jgi:hypothetical protein